MKHKQKVSRFYQQKSVSDSINFLQQKKQQSFHLYNIISSQNLKKNQQNQKVSLFDSIESSIQQLVIDQNSNNQVMYFQQLVQVKNKNKIMINQNDSNDYIQLSEYGTGRSNIPATLKKPKFGFKVSQTAQSQILQNNMIEKVIESVQQQYQIQLDKRNKINITIEENKNRNKELLQNIMINNQDYDDEKIQKYYQNRIMTPYYKMAKQQRLSSSSSLSKRLSTKSLKGYKKQSSLSKSIMKASQLYRQINHSMTMKQSNQTTKNQREGSDREFKMVFSPKQRIQRIEKVSRLNININNNEINDNDYKGKQYHNHRNNQNIKMHKFNSLTNKVFRVTSAKSIELIKLQRKLKQLEEENRKLSKQIRLQSKQQ